MVDGIDSFDSTILMGYKGKLFTLYSNFEISEQTYGFASVGSGGDIALGSLYTSKKMHIKKRIKLALESSEKFNITVRRPFIIKSI